MTRPTASLLADIAASVRLAARDPMFVILSVALLALLAMVPTTGAALLAAIDGPTVYALTGLLILARAAEHSGVLAALAARLVTLCSTERRLALTLCGASAVLSAAITNDVALFVVVPITLALADYGVQCIGLLVTFEAMAVNVGSSLTPVGNPQNLLLWHQAGVSMATFVEAMWPLVAGLVLVLCVFASVTFGQRKIARHRVASPLIDTALARLALLGYVPFVLLCEFHHSGLALVLLAIVGLWVRPSTVVRMDWLLIMIFVLMFVDLRLVAGLDGVRQLIGMARLSAPVHLLGTGVLVSQCISNVPAAILLSQYSDNWRLLAWATNIGGFGTAIGSLANLIAVRLSRGTVRWTTFHVVSFAFLASALGLGALVLHSLNWLE